MNILHQAQYLVNTLSPEWGPITPLKLQKLLYYVKAWGLVGGHPLVEAPFMKWKHGPVNADVYHAYREHGRNPIPYCSTPYEPTGEEKELIAFIGTCYAQFNALTLSAMTHKEDPWKLTEPDQPIPERLMQQYYSHQPFAKNFPFDPDGKPFFPVDSDLGHSFTMDMGKEVAEQVTVYPSYNDYLAYLKEARGEFDTWFNGLLK